jgi:acetyltransferase-like isoleucine patch superfamily enzyme
MKRLIKKAATLLILLLLKLKGLKSTVKKSILFLSKFQIEKLNDLQIIGATLGKCIVQIQGKNNELLIFGEIHNSKINIWGDNNQIIISPKVKLNNATIVLRGTNCIIEIGEGTTFGGIYMVCMGKNNYIKIGKECMFADGIDIWATDSHPIYDEDNFLINPSKPIIIGNNVWIGAKSSILKGVLIEDGAVIGMSSIVTKNVASFTLNVGNPLRCVKTNVNWEREFIKD